MAPDSCVRSVTTAIALLSVALVALAASPATAAAPAHDDFAEALVVSGTTGSAKLTMAGSTIQVGEPGGDGSADGSVWLRWTAPATGTWKADAGRWDQVVWIWTGSALTSLAPASTTGCPSDTGSDNYLDAVAGTTYRWQVRGPNWSAAADAVVSWAPKAADNDDFSDAVDLGDDHPVDLQVDTCLADAESGEPILGTRSDTVWFRWTAPHTMRIRLGNNFSPDLGVRAYTGSSVGALTPVGASGAASQALFRAVRGTTYHLQVASLEGEGYRQGEINLRHLVADNDMRHAFRPMPETDQQPFARRGLVLTDNLDATAEPGEPALLADRSMQSLWWSIEPLVHGTLVLDTSGSETNTVIGLYRGHPEGELTRVASADGGGSTPGSARLVAAVAGGSARYTVLVDTMDGTEGGIDLRWSLAHPRPANDDFGAATGLRAAAGTTRSWTFSASRQPGEPAHGGVSTGRTVWWDFIAPESGRATFTSSGISRALSAYRGASLGDLRRVADARVAWPSATLSFLVRSGRTYRIAYGTDENTPPSPVTLSWAIAPTPPANDDRADARVLSGRSGALSMSTVGATAQPELGEQSDRATVWFRWKATHTGWETFRTSGSQAATGLEVYPPGSAFWANVFGSPGSDVWAYRAYPGSYAHRYVRVVEGRSYLVQLATTVQSANTVRLAWSRSGPPGRPVNDDLTGATPISGGQGTIDADNTRATYEPGESLLLDECPTCGFSEGDHFAGIWWTWTSPSTGTVRFDTGSEGPFGWLELYREGADISELQLVRESVGSPPDAAYEGSLLDAPVVAGRSYLLRYSSQEARAFPLRWRVTAGDTSAPYPPAPANDDFADAIAITGTHGATLGTTEWSTLQPGEPDLTDIEHSVWYRWTAPASGPATLGVPPAGAPGLGGQTVHVWRGSSLGSLTVVPSTHWGQPVQRPTVEVTAGTTYYLQVGTASRRFDLTWDITVPPNDDLADAYQLPPTATGSSPWWGLVRSTGEAGEPATMGDDQAENSVWMKWVPERSGPVSFVTGGDHAPVLDVFTGPANVGSLTRVTESGYSADFDAVAGTTYWIRLHAELSPNGAVRWSQHWDRTRPVVGAVLDGGATLTEDAWVTLELKGSDTGSGLRGWLVSLAASHGEVLAAAWVPAEGRASRTVSWSVTHTAYGGHRFEGTRTVYVQAVDRQHNLSPLAGRVVTLRR